MGLAVRERICSSVYRCVSVFVHIVFPTQIQRRSDESAECESISRAVGLNAGIQLPNFILHAPKGTVGLDRLGGVYSIAAVVDDFINRIMGDPRLNANPLVDEAHHRVPPAGVQVPRDRDGLLGYGRPRKNTRGSRWPNRIGI